MTFDPGFAITPTMSPMGFQYGEGVFGPAVEYRALDAIRPSLRDAGCSGPDPVYAIAMDTGKRTHRRMLEERRLLYGAVTYAAGRLGSEPVRSQGHIHRRVRGQHLSPPEVYEIWTGEAIILMQERASDDPGRCFAVKAAPGEIVVVPPDWAHATISADAETPLTFGAWCDRDFAFEYDKVRAHNGLAWFPLVADNGAIIWSANPSYKKSTLIIKPPADYGALGIRSGTPIYTQFERDPDRFLFVSRPELKEECWKDFIP